MSSLFVRFHAIARTNAGILLIGTLRIKCSEIWIKMQHFSFTMFLSSYHHDFVRSNYHWQKVMCMQKIKVWDQRSRSQRPKQILPQFGHFRIVTSVWIHRWLRNDAQRLKWHRRCVLLFFKVIRQIWMSHEPKNHQFDPDFSVSGR